MLLTRKAFDDADPGEVVLQGRADFGDTFTRDRVERADSAVVEANQKRVERERSEGNERELPVE